MRQEYGNEEKVKTKFCDGFGVGRKHKEAVKVRKDHGGYIQKRYPGLFTFYLAPPP